MKQPKDKLEYLSAVRVNKTMARKMFERGYVILVTMKLDEHFTFSQSELWYKGDTEFERRYIGKNFNEMVLAFYEKKRSMKVGYTVQFYVGENEKIRYKKELARETYLKWYKKHH